MSGNPQHEGLDIGFWRVVNLRTAWSLNMMSG
eukprot:CAMPEP_0197931086 /NCGR_PEP_ID=MMETSP1439-20131203/106564_1 /TAXON_ID=66791 /ORGANISM="Gonyaulax spinifera, Strain CCMP409" /LENGTH=31 /DNA_ID= /DNA_START= /DNA_END= /DNA_ORIENTATION=